MLKPAMTKIIGENGDAYSFVVAVAKRAREISDHAEENNEVLDVKPVRLAVDEFADGECKYTIEHTEDEDVPAEETEPETAETETEPEDTDEE
jgi:DNA-directed RNA polymerase subunit omega